MYELWVAADGYIQGKKAGRASKSTETLIKRAKKTLGDDIVTTDELSKDSQCIWIDLADGTPIGLIRPKPSTD